MRWLFLLAAVAGFAPVQVAADTLNADYLRSILSDPVGNGWVEAPQSVGKYLDGPLTVDTLSSYYRYYRQTPEFIQGYVQPLEQNGFLGGYARQWFKSVGSDDIGEWVLVFPAASQATSELLALQVNAQPGTLPSTTFGVQLGDLAFGSLIGDSSLTFATVGFTLGNAVYIVSLIAERTLASGDVLPDARQLASQAPKTIKLESAPSLSKPGLTAKPFNLPALIVGGALSAVAVITVVALVAVWLVRPRRRPGVGSVIKTTDGRFWWDGTSWQDSTMVSPGHPQTVGQPR